MPLVALALVMAAALGGGTSVAAQNALPGEPLWGFKVGVNERVQEALTPHERARAELEIALAATRLDEAETLALRGVLTLETQTAIERNFTLHTQALARHIAALQRSGEYAAAADLVARFQAMVAAHASSLAEARPYTTELGSAALGRLVERVHATLDDASTLSAAAALTATSAQ